ncbi:MAG: hypothetical protein K9J37_21795 [Saprospiraceae bacterium]|nr:hypothetical protein [Saprospiraceae bacterium]MCF8252555.1 hypothetical protein [Saprospiraceae bacterium]MCF8282596.1 hypothetical protein [Bacteroidales bacterium]MCF8310802.1 hypothetical protein [Saprospiraceae bacterium]MCF8439368.1 hypothetical protein [Saprospiraceae bacterium]
MNFFQRVISKNDTIEITDIKNSTVTLNVNDIESIQRFITQNNEVLTEEIKQKLIEIVSSSREGQQVLLKSYEDIMLRKGVDYQDLIDFPVLNEIENKNSLVYFDKNLLERINTYILDSSIRKILIKGAGGRGKTVLSRLFAYFKKREGWDIFFIDIREISESDIDVITEEIEKKLEQTVPTLLVIENAHVSDAICEKLIRISDYFNAQHQNSHFLFLSRDYAKDEDVNPFYEWKQRNWFIELKPNNETINAIIEKFIRYNTSSYLISLKDKEWIKNFILTKNSKNNATIDGDLRLLRLFLASWNDNSKYLWELNEHDILAKLKKHYYINELSREEGLLEILGIVASVFQFDVPFYSKKSQLKDTIFLIEYLDKLRKRGLVRFIGQGKYILSHSLDAYYLNKCISSLQGEENELFTAQNVIQYLSELPKIPRERIKGNVFGIFKGFFAKSPGGLNGLKVYEIIYGEAKDFVLDNLTHYHIGIITYTLQFFNRSYGKDKAMEFWSLVQSKYNNDFWNEKINESDALTSSILCMNLGKIDEQAGADFFNKYLRNSEKHSDFFKFGNLITLQHFIRNLPDDLVESILPTLSKSDYAKHFVSTKSFATANLSINKISRTILGKQFLKEVFQIIDETYFDELKKVLLNTNGFISIQRFREALRACWGI